MSNLQFNLILPDATYNEMDRVNSYLGSERLGERLAKVLTDYKPLFASEDISTTAEPPYHNIAVTLHTDVIERMQQWADAHKVTIDHMMHHAVRQFVAKNPIPLLEKKGPFIIGNGVTSIVLTPPVLAPSEAEKQAAQAEKTGDALRRTPGKKFKPT